jgi:hypothetical protein
MFQLQQVDNVLLYTDVSIKIRSSMLEFWIEFRSSYWHLSTCCSQGSHPSEVSTAQLEHSCNEQYCSIDCSSILVGLIHCYVQIHTGFIPNILHTIYCVQVFSFRYTIISTNAQTQCRNIIFQMGKYAKKKPQQTNNNATWT